MERAFHHAKKALQPSLRSEEIDSIVKLMRDRVCQFQDSVHRNRDQWAFQTERNTQSTLYEVQATRQVGIDTRLGVGQVNDKVVGLVQDNRQFQVTHIKVHSELARLSESLAAQDELLTVLLHQSPNPTIIIQHDPVRQDPESFLPGYQLLEAPNVDPILPVRDLECVTEALSSNSGGFRIELAEIENVLIKASESILTHAVVTLREDNEEQFLIAHVGFSVDRVRTGQQGLNRLQATLPVPEYMCLALIILLDEMALTAHCKIGPATEALPLDTVTIARQTSQLVERELQLEALSKVSKTFCLMRLRPNMDAVAASCEQVSVYAEVLPKSTED
ncbi:hypothetical protein BDW62DRAFT_198930 [Aspergillus aurantiobrunneus]